ncbi:MAG TPA: GNAT family N-acetyltransferase [Opitutaceae bacterium]|nr:GNAT family N-acetyltransferase [Opitutaceae bacterium]
MKPGADWQLRPMTLADYDAVIALWRASEGIGLSAADERDAIAAYLERNPGMSFVAVATGHVVGAVLGGHDGRRGYLHHLAVAPASRHRGIGRALVEASLVRLKAAGMQKCNLFLYHGNVAGRAFWEKHGWSAREDLVLVQKPLT